MKKWLKCIVIFFFFTSLHNLIAQRLSLEDLSKMFEKDANITLPLSQITISSYNYRHNNLLVEAIIFSPIDKVFRFPALILIPGYEKTARDYIPIGIQLAREGFVCLAITQPGFGRSEGKPDWVGPYTINTLIKGYQKLKKETFVDSENIGIYGYSRGALAASILAVKLENIKAAAFLAGIYDFKKAYEEIQIEGIKRNMELETGMSKKAIDERSSINMMDKLDCPVFILHGEKDKNAPVNQAYLLRDKLAELKKEFKFKILPDTGHSIGRENLRYVYNFFIKKLFKEKELVIKTVNKTDVEIKTKDKLESLLSKYDTSKWIFTNKILIKEGLRSHSHPVLTVATQHYQDDLLLLATFIHEQIHWFVKAKVNGRKILDELKQKYPEVPVGFSIGGGHDEFSTYLHLIVCYFEYKALEKLVSTKVAEETLKRRDVYSWVYKTIFDNKEYFKELFKKHNYSIDIF